MNEDKIESVVFYKYIHPSAQIYEKTITPNSLMAISLPRVKFLEVDGEYRPSWAVDKDKPKTFIPSDAPQAQHRAYKKETHRKLMYKRGGYAITGLEQTVHDMIQEGFTKLEICQKLKKQMSAVSGALGRYEIKTLAKQNKK